MGASERATPGYLRVPVVAAAGPGLVLSGGLGYGFTESLDAAPGDHHRMSGRIAASAAPLPWLNLAAGTHLRHDRHAEDALGSDQGTVIDSQLHVLAGARLDSDWHLGAGVGASFTRGDSVGSSLANPAIDALLLGGYVPRNSPVSVGLLAGYRYDRTAGVANAPALYRSGDRLSLGLSEFDALLFGAGAGYRWGATELLAELGADVLVGKAAPGLRESPLRLGAGARHHFDDQLSVRLSADASLSARPPVGADDPLVPVDPRVQLSLGVVYRFPSPGPAALAPEAPPPPLPPAPPPPPLPASLEVQVTTLEGYPLSDARVELVDGETVIEVPHAELQDYRLAQVAARAVTLRVSAARLETHTQPIELLPGKPLRIDVRMAPAPPVGQLRGQVRSFSGEGLRARVRIEPLGKSLETDPAGSFLIDVSPGWYEVVIEAAGHATQRRRLEVPEDGVVILNADLLRGSP